MVILRQESETSVKNPVELWFRLAFFGLTHLYYSLEFTFGKKGFSANLGSLNNALLHEDV